MALSLQIQAGSDQSLRRRSHWKIVVAGRDVTAKMDPHLISVQVVLRSEGEDECNIELDDRNGLLEIPPDRAPVEVSLGWAGEGPHPSVLLAEHVQDIYDLIPASLRGTDTVADITPLAWEGTGMRIVFQGYTSSVESGFNRKGGGRRLWIEAKSSDQGGLIKQPHQKTWGEGHNGEGVSASKVLQEAAQKAGLNFSMEGAPGDIKRPFWHQNESFMNFGQRVAREVGGVFKVQGTHATIRDATKPIGVVIKATWGVNLIAWRIKPFIARPQFKGSKRRWFDVFDGTFQSITKAIGGEAPFGAADATHDMPAMAPDGNVGDQYNGGTDADSQNKRGTGWIIINGEPSAKAMAMVVLKGARTGVDGSYLVEEAEHNYTRGGGFTTRLNLKLPLFISYSDTWRTSQGATQPPPAGSFTEPTPEPAEPPSPARPSTRVLTLP